MSSSLSVRAFICFSAFNLSLSLSSCLSHRFHICLSVLLSVPTTYSASFVYFKVCNILSFLVSVSSLLSFPQITCLSLIPVALHSCLCNTCRFSSGPLVFKSYCLSLCSPVCLSTHPSLNPLTACQIYLSLSYLIRLPASHLSPCLWAVLCCCQTFLSVPLLYTTCHPLSARALICLSAPHLSPCLPSVFLCPPVCLTCLISISLSCLSSIPPPVQASHPSLCLDWSVYALQHPVFLCVSLTVFILSLLSVPQPTCLSLSVFCCIRILTAFW